MTKSRLRSHAPTSLLTPSPTPSPRELSPEPSSCDAGAGRTMNSSRPVSLAASMGFRMPTLKEILSDSASQPYTLGAFMAYLSQNHCLETLEFTMEAERYRAAYAQSQHSILEYPDHLCSLWQKLIQAYIQPSGSREVNLPSHVRDHLLSLSCGPPPPDPAELDEAVKIVYELMSDSVLVPFVESFSHQQEENVTEETEKRRSRHSRSRSRCSKDMSKDESSRSPRTSFLPHLSISMSRKSDVISRSAASSSSDAGDREDLTDDSGINTPPGYEPMTPPTTPPTTDWAFATSPGTTQKAFGSHSNGWKRVSAKFLGKRARSAHRPAASAGTSAARLGAEVPQTLWGRQVMPPPTSSTPTPFFESAATPSDDMQMKEWEEPHPGRRLSYPNDRTTTWGASTRDRGRRDGMTAEGRWPENPRFSFAVPAMKERRHGRSRTRNPPPHLVITNSDKAKPEIQTAPLPRFDRSHRRDASAHKVETHVAVPSKDTSDYSDVSGPDSDTDSSTAATLSVSRTLQPLDTSVQLLDFTDFSNHIGMTMDVDHPAHFTVAGLESSAFNVMSPDGDMYGWDAVLDRKAPQPPSEVGPSKHLRRTSRSKRSFLQRVFSPGSSTIDESSNDSTSLSWPNDKHV